MRFQNKINFVNVQNKNNLDKLQSALCTAQSATLLVDFFSCTVDVLLSPIIDCTKYFIN